MVAKGGKPDRSACVRSNQTIPAFGLLIAMSLLRPSCYREWLSSCVEYRSRIQMMFHLTEIHTSHRHRRKSRSFALPIGGRSRLTLLTFMLGGAAVCQTAAVSESISVRYVEGQVHGFLSLRTLDGALIADGELTQASHGASVTSRLAFHFKDGSLQDETTVFSQRGGFHILTDHLVQKGPAFKRQVDLSLNGSSGLVAVRYKDDDGKEKVADARLELPPNLANGIVPVLLRNIAPGAQSAAASMVVATPKPELVKLAISAEGEDWFVTGGARHKATRYVVKVEIGGVRGVVAPLVGKQPPDTHVWILGGSSPAFVKSEGPSCEGCPIWRTELVSPVWPESGKEATASKK
jgi:hypothetical protein